MRRLSALSVLAPLALLALGCSPSIPARYVVERPIGEYDFRRYQHVLDVELVVPENPGDGHTAVYVARRGEGMEVLTAFVSVYQQPASLAAEVKERLERLGTYDRRVIEVEGENVWELDGGDDRWLLWVSSNRVVKLGAPNGGEIPEDFAEIYLDLYPSDLDEHGRAREGTASVGASRSDGEDEPGRIEPEMPSNLR